MIISPDKSKLTLERLAIENQFLKENLKLNINEIIKRKQDIKKLNELYDLELILTQNRKIFGFEIEYKSKDKVEANSEVISLIKSIFRQNYGNIIKELNQIYNFIHLRLKYNMIYETREIETPLFIIRQINPKYILKKQENLIENY